MHCKVLFRTEVGRRLLLLHLMCSEIGDNMLIFGIKGEVYISVTMLSTDVAIVKDDIHEQYVSCCESRWECQNAVEDDIKR